LLKHLAKSLNVNIVYVNMVGGQDELLFDGASLVVLNNGDLICSLPFFEESLCVADLPVTLKENVTAVLSSKLEEETKVNTISIDAVVSDSTQVAQNVMIPEDDIANLYKGLVFAIREYVL